MFSNSEKEVPAASIQVRSSEDELNKAPSSTIPVNDRKENIGAKEDIPVETVAKETFPGQPNVSQTINLAPASQPLIGQPVTATSQLPNNPVPASQPANPVPASQPANPVPASQPANPVPASQPANPVPASQPASQPANPVLTSQSPVGQLPAEQPLNQPVVNQQPEQLLRNEALLSKIAQKKEAVQRLNDELYYLRHCNAELADKEKGTHERMLLRQKDQQQLLNNYNEHVRSRRATEDDTATIRAKLQELKAMIKNVSVKLTSQCDAKVATGAISSFWINLNDAIAKLGTPIPKKRLCMLTEKFLMDVLVQSMNYNTFPGLKISQPYTQLQMWFDKYDPEFCTRLRQEVAKTVVVGTNSAPDIQAETSKFSKRMYNSLYSSLLKAYPFMEKYDAQEQDVGKKYSSLIQRMVEQATNIGYAIRGQEVEIAAAAVGEGSEPLDLKTMNDEDGQSSGIIQFCVCPPFVVYGSRIEILEKARVLCSPLNKS
ncbi:hypothetical protein G6F56_001646 [Rhizopus delemar]|uniref:Uncharacterized protein n=1 Tax=Rhizopus stolonifer TaxID=4846 RepID=A0A367JSL2_RHIST|nr:hypothetical protein G6F56_001646 [Rhizopus delemar]RCH92930.1 hypothetical protein CU098_003898 [Rhizopus stolonifer]